MFSVINRYKIKFYACNSIPSLTLVFVQLLREPQVGKETGETAHVERWNCTLRQRLARFVRKTLFFSKSISMHIACLDVFLHRSNLERATILV
jgi:IS1 family transposase